MNFNTNYKLWIILFILALFCIYYYAWVFNLIIGLWLIIYFLIKILIKGHLFKHFLQWQLDCFTSPPFSSIEISYLNDFSWDYPKKESNDIDFGCTVKNMQTDLIKLLKSLDKNKTYSASFALIPTDELIDNLKTGIVVLNIEKTIIINKNSDSFLLTTFLMDNINQKFSINEKQFPDKLLNILVVGRLTEIIVNENY